jgi:glyoxalase family protein
MQTAGLHHITAITADVQKNVNFYEGFLGQRFIKKTVNFDDPESYHLYYGDYVGSPGTALTFFSWSHLPKRSPGYGEASAWYYRILKGSIDYWTTRAEEFGVPYEKTVLHHEDALLLTDPDEHQVYLVEVDSTDEPPLQFWDDGPIPREHQLRGFYGIRLSVLALEVISPILTEVFGYTELATDAGLTRFVVPSTHGQVVDVAELYDAPRAIQGHGSIHHVAFRAKDSTEREAFRGPLTELGVASTETIERFFFEATYFWTPSGILFEISTDAPGFTVNEPAEELGENMILPPWYEPYRAEIVANLPPITLPRHGKNK